VGGVESEIREVKWRERKRLLSGPKRVTRFIGYLTGRSRLGRTVDAWVARGRGAPGLTGVEVFLGGIAEAGAFMGIDLAVIGT
jgi:hypothetical protein